MNEIMTALGTMGVAEQTIAAMGAAYLVGGQICSLLSSLIPQAKMEGTRWGGLIDRWALNVGQAKNAEGGEK